MFIVKSLFLQLAVFFLAYEALAEKDCTQLGCIAVAKGLKRQFDSDRVFKHGYTFQRLLAIDLQNSIAQLEVARGQGANVTNLRKDSDDGKTWYVVAEVTIWRANRHVFASNASLQIDLPNVRHVKEAYLTNCNAKIRNGVHC